MVKTRLIRRCWRVEHLFDRVASVDRHELERIRRSIVMLPPGHTAGALTRESALDLIEEVARSSEETARYRLAIDRLRDVIRDLDLA
jgi:hypothetical protein